MKQFQVTVPWPDGLHVRPAAKLVQAVRALRATVQLKCNGNIADIRSILSVLTLCAGMGMSVDVVVEGEDEQAAAQSVARVFQEMGHTGLADDAQSQP